jgi:hypothetical protein
MTFNWKKFLLYANLVSLVVRFILQLIFVIKFEKEQASQNETYNMWAKKDKKNGKE